MAEVNGGQSGFIGNRALGRFGTMGRFPAASQQDMDQQQMQLSLFTYRAAITACQSRWERLNKMALEVGFLKICQAKIEVFCLPQRTGFMALGRPH